MKLRFHRAEDVVVVDECEGGKRRILNFGHTVGHALETHFGFDILRHGEAVAYGMQAAGKLSNEDGRLKIEDFELLQTTIKKLPLPQLPKFDAENIIKIMQTDKKIKDGEINFVLLEEIGKTVIVDCIGKESITKAMESL